MAEFDLTVHKRNVKGVVVSTNPYRLEINNGIRRFERPVGSGIWYDGAGKLFPESEQLIKENAAKEVAAAQAKVAKEVQDKKAAEELKIKAASYDSLKANQDKLLAKIAELEKRVK